VRLAAVVMFSFCLLVTTAAASPAATQRFADVGPIDLAGGTLQHCRIGYRTFGTMKPDGSNTVVVPTWLTGRTQDLEGLFGREKLVDPSTYFVVAIDAIGDGVSCSPSQEPRRSRLAFPRFTIDDMVESQYRVVTRTLGLRHIRAVIGISMGGMQAFDWAAKHADFLDRAVSIVGTPQPDSQDLLTWTAEQRAIDGSAQWRSGSYDGSPPFPALAIVHTLALSTPSQRSAQTPRADVPAFLESTYRDTFKNFNVVDWYRQLQAMIVFDIAGGSTLDVAASRIRVPMLVVTSAQDRLVSPEPSKRLADLLGAKTLQLSGDCGHVAPICEMEKTSPAVASFLSLDRVKQAP